jgi:cytochrome c5
MAKPLESIVNGRALQPDKAEVVPLRQVKSRYDAATEQKREMGEYTCDAVCNDCHCATY